MATDIKRATKDTLANGFPGLPEIARRAVEHPIFPRLKSLEAVKVFMEHHIWCVWDFMYLAKSVHSSLSGRGAWSPSPCPETLADFNDILATEETDIGPTGKLGSHFEFFVEAMEQAGADTIPVRAFQRQVELGEAPLLAMRKSKAPTSAIQFVSATMNDASGPTHIRAASFCLAREDLVPRLLRRLRRYVPWNHPRLEMLKWYVDRHIELDTVHHGPTGRRILAAVIAGDSNRRAEASAAAELAIAARVKYLDAILRSL